MTKKIVFLSLFVVSCLQAIAQLGISARELKQLDYELSQTQVYDKAKYARIDKLKKAAKSSMKSNEKLFKSLYSLGKEYETFISDSSLFYFNKSLEVARQMNDSDKTVVARLGKVKVLGILGLFKEGAAELETIEKSPVPAKLQTEWLDAGRQLYAYMAAYTEHDNSEYSRQHTRMLNFYRDAEIKKLKPGTPIYKLFLAEHYDANGQGEKAKELLSDLIAEIPNSNNIYARAAHNQGTRGAKQRGSLLSCAVGNIRRERLGKREYVAPRTCRISLLHR